MKKDKGKAPPKKFKKQRRAYIAWESDSDSSDNDNSSGSYESANLCLMAHTNNQSYHKKDNHNKQVR